MTSTDTITHAEQRRALYRALADTDLPAPESVTVNVTDGQAHGTMRLPDDDVAAVDEWVMAHNGTPPTWFGPHRPPRGERFPFEPFRSYAAVVNVVGIELRVLTHVHDVPGGAR